ncbi:MAG: hypothetical protein E7507_01230 [Ruminococcus sp.]|nr:hypothetical protein [Ruminococcus sp.]
MDSTEDQWWITGFAYKETYTDIKNQVVIGSVDFSKHEEMYNSFSNEMSMPDNIYKRDYVIFDNDNKTIWICWYEEDLVK